MHALQRDGLTVVRQKGSHIRLQKKIKGGLLKGKVETKNPNIIIS